MNFIVTTLQKLPVWALLLMSASAVITGDFLAKYWSTKPSNALYVSVIAAYLLSSILYIPTLLKEGLVVTAVIWSFLNIAGFLVIGLVLFKETLTPVQVVGVVFGVVSLILLSIGK